METKKLLRPPQYEEFDGPVIFLAGPIKSATDWQAEAIKYISKNAPDIYIACPRREGGLEKDFGKEKYNEQVDWETYHLNKAGDKGCVIFWLSKEYEHDCSRAYAQTSRFELGEWKTKNQILGSNLVVGFEEGFSNAKYIKRRLAQDCPKVPICDNLEDVCKKAIELIRKK